VLEEIYALEMSAWVAEYIIHYTQSLRELLKILKVLDKN